MNIRPFCKIFLALILFGVAPAFGAEEPPTVEEALAILDQLKSEGVMSPTVFVPIWRGEFVMGCEEVEGGAFCDEDITPQKRVNIPYDFEMMNTEVTQAQWLEFLIASLGRPGQKLSEIYSKENKPTECPGNFIARLALCPNHPIVNISLSQAKEYAAYQENLFTSRAGLPLFEVRLPTGQEWEYAARAGTQTPYYWGEKREDSITYELADRGFPYPRFPFRHPGDVASRLPNPWQLYDMLGNVREMVFDRQVEDEMNRDPGEFGRRRFLRGGNYNVLAQTYDRIAANSTSDEAGVDDDIGFRLVRVRVVSTMPPQQE